MATLAQAIRQAWLRRIIWTVVILLVLYGIAAVTGPKLGAVLEALTPPVLPPRQEISAQVWPGDQNWSRAQSDQFHFEGQGTGTLPIPLAWFLALEQPANHWWQVPFSHRGRFARDDYLLRFGFIHAEKSRYNPYGLPIGLVATPNQHIVGIRDPKTAIGFTCAACHTGQLLYQGKQYVVDGGPADTDLGQLTLALGAALGQTALSARVPFLDGRFERFAKAVLKDQYSDGTRNQLEKDLDSVIAYLATRPNGIDVTEGFSRLDALNRIGNQVFAWDTGRYSNYVNINAPVNFPFIWTSSWFNWVQYDGSIMQPLIRNAGEAMGVAAHIDFKSPPGQGRFGNSIPMRNLHWIEGQLAGKDNPTPATGFSGLRAPAWPKAFPPIDTARAAQGAALYKRYCSGCHLPALTRDVETGAAPDSPFWKHFAPITWYADGREVRTSESLLRVVNIPLKHIGTDPAQADVLVNRTVDTSGSASGTLLDHTQGLGIDADVCAFEPSWPGMIQKPKLVTVHVGDSGDLLFALALGAAVQQGIDQWFEANFMDADGRLAIEGDRPNCLRAGAGYKARPLNGVWATAPFLHNGSVPTLMALLGPVKDRPKAFLLGDPTFDPVNVGIEVKKASPGSGDYNRQGYFIMDTTKPGNHNTGHEFSDTKGPGVIGPALSKEQRQDIVEFLKTM